MSLTTLPETKRSSQRLFIYGTLRKGFALHSHIERLGARYVGKGKIHGSLYSLGEFPGAVRCSSGSDEIIGEVYELQDGDRHLEQLDAVEEFYPDRLDKSLFVRSMTTVRMLDGRTLKAWSYFLPKKPSKGRPIYSGDYGEGRRARH